MKILLKPIVIFILFFILSSEYSVSKSENNQRSIGFGVSSLYNFPTQSFGLGARAYFPMGKRFDIVPQFKYLPDFNPITEYYMGINLHYHIVKISYFDIYISAGLLYNRWINFILTENSISKKK
jgi:hypothetical protein